MWKRIRRKNIKSWRNGTCCPEGIMTGLKEGVTHRSKKSIQELPRWKREKFGQKRIRR
jgi:hypothetical protein